jgi:hypothetical protein
MQPDHAHNELEDSLARAVMPRGWHYAGEFRRDDRRLCPAT